MPALSFGEEKSMPYVRVDILKGLSTSQKLEIQKGITDLLVKVAGKNPDYTFVVINEVSDEDWGHKGTSIAELKKAKAAAEKAPAKKAGAKVSAPIKRGPAKK
jgi:4-oxalocrotonate tautomerase